MIVIDTSIFVDLIFEYDSKRTEMADILFESVQQKEFIIFEPEIFKIELIGQLSRRTKKEEALKIAEEFFEEVNFVDHELFGTAFSIALETGSRAIDSFYVAVANNKDSILISNDKLQVETARKFNVEAYYLLEDFEKVKVRILNTGT